MLSWMWMFVKMGACNEYEKRGVRTNVAIGWDGSTTSYVVSLSSFLTPIQTVFV